jgi:hypothetical protein
MYRIAALCLTLACALPAWADDDAEAHAKVVAPFVDERTFAVASVDLMRVDVAGLVARITELGKFRPAALQTQKAEAQRILTGLTRAGARQVYVIFSLSDLPQEPPVFVVPLAGGADVQTLKGVVQRLGFGLETVQIGQALVGGSKKTLDRVRSLTPVPLPGLAQAFAATGNTALQLVVVPTADIRRGISEMIPTLPKELGGGSTKALWQGLHWVAIGLELPPKLMLREVIQCRDPASARSLHDLIVQAYAALAKDKDFQTNVPGLAQMIGRLTPKIEGDRLTLNLEEKELVAVLQPMLVQARDAADRIQSSNQLKQIGLAFHNYHDTYRAFPAWASYDRQNKPLLSWRVHLLPYLEQGALYKEFHLDEPWDSEHNKKLIARMPKIYAGEDAALAAAGKTTYLAPLGDQTMFPIGPKGLKISDVTDGTSNTIFIVQSKDENPVIWTKPDDLKVDPKQPAARLADHNGRGYLALFVDGSVHMLPANTMTVPNLWALFTRNGGEVVRID